MKKQQVTQDANLQQQRHFCSCSMEEEWMGTEKNVCVDNGEMKDFTPEDSMLMTQKSLSVRDLGIGQKT